MVCRHASRWALWLLKGVLRAVRRFVWLEEFNETPLCYFSMNSLIFNLNRRRHKSDSAEKWNVWCWKISGAVCRTRAHVWWERLLRPKCLMFGHNYLNWGESSKRLGIPNEDGDSNPVHFAGVKARTNCRALSGRKCSDSRTHDSLFLQENL
jgi:hypothetical protein